MHNANASFPCRQRLAVLALALTLLLPGASAWAAEVPPGATGLVGKLPEHHITADHSKHPALQQPFASPQEVTKACLSCHNQAALQVHKTIHWTWLDPADPTRKMGKGGITFNNFCIAVPSNEPRCTSCHAGYGWKDKNFDFSAQENVDCLVCHDRTGTYKKFPTMAGMPVSEPTKFGEEQFDPPDYNAVAAAVGRPTRDNCGNCHFYGGGGDAVKHGDLDSSLHTPKREIDVHMDVKGANFTCQRCHTTDVHFIAGRTYKEPAFTERKSLVQDDQVKRIACESCHTATPHKAGHKANDHTDKVACQTCHIPAYARAIPTKMWWDWSTAGKKKDGKNYKEKGPLGKPVYDTQKGDFRWEQNVVPEYKWYGGRMDYLLLTDKVDPAKPVEINRVIGSPDDPNARIMPFKVHRGKQPFDPELKTFVVPHLFGKDDAAYWKTYDWAKAIEAGQKAVGLPWSGKYTFVETAYHYPITHMVAPKEKALQCADCHNPAGRLAGVGGVWMPGRDASSAADTLGWIAVIGSLCAVTVHGILRLNARKRNDG